MITNTSSPWTMEAMRDGANTHRRAKAILRNKIIMGMVGEGAKSQGRRVGLVVEEEFRLKADRQWRTMVEDQLTTVVEEVEEVVEGILMAAAVMQMDVEHAHHQYVQGLLIQGVSSSSCN
jgi:hypothetical protein